MLDQRGIFQAAHPVADTRGIQRTHRAPDAVRPNRLAGVWRPCQAGRACALEDCFEFHYRVASFYTAKSQRHHAIAHRLDRPVGHRPRLFYRSLASEIEHQPHADAQLGLGPGARAIKRGQLFAESQAFRAVVGERGIDHFAVADTLRSLAAEELARDKLDILNRTDAAGHMTVDFDKVIEVAEAVPRAQFVERRSRRPRAMTPGQLQQGLRPNGAFEMDVQLNL